LERYRIVTELLRVDFCNKSILWLHSSTLPTKHFLFMLVTNRTVYGVRARVGTIMVVAIPKHHQEIDDKIGETDRKEKVAAGTIVEEWDPETLPGSNIMRYRHNSHGGSNTTDVVRTKRKHEEIEGDADPPPL
jgi:hypothetical protein